MDIVIYGAGGFGREISCLLRHINDAGGGEWRLLGFVDDGKRPGWRNEYGEVLGGHEWLNAYSKPIAVVMAIGSPKTLKFLVGRLANPNLVFPNIIAPNVLFFDRDSSRLGKGNIITFGCRLSCNTQLGDFNVLNGCVSLGHDARLGSYNVMMPESRLSGEVEAGDMNLFGARSFVAQQIRIGSRTTIAAGSVVLRRTKDDALYMGNPAKRIEI